MRVENNNHSQQSKQQQLRETEMTEQHFIDIENDYLDSTDWDQECLQEFGFTWSTYTALLDQEYRANEFYPSLKRLVQGAINTILECSTPRWGWVDLEKRILSLHNDMLSSVERGYHRNSKYLICEELLQLLREKSAAA